MLKHIHAIDTRIFQHVFTAYRRSPLAIFARQVSRTGDGWYYLLLVPLFWLMQPDDAWNSIKVVFGGFMLERAVYFAMKNTCRRRRPPDALDNIQSLVTATDKFSFPSGHTSAAFFVATVLVAGFGPACLPLYSWAASVGASRVILGVHFPSDILAGAMIGTTLAMNLPL